MPLCLRSHHSILSQPQALDCPSVPLQLPAPPKPSEPQVDEAGYVAIFAEGDGAPKEQHRLWWAANPDNSKYPSAQPLASIDRCTQDVKAEPATASCMIAVKFAATACTCLDVLQGVGCEFQYPEACPFACNQTGQGGEGGAWRCTAAA